VKLTRRFAAIVLLLCLALAQVTPSQAQGTERQYFRETGHTVSGDFWSYYQGVKNATQLFGYPITEQYVKDGRLVQYFQRARFEFYPERPLGQQVQLAALGREMYTPGTPIKNENSLSCRKFNETGYSVCYAFLDFFLKNGGATIFGYPISQFEYREGKIVQYFENSRFEWRPSMPEGQRVGLTDLGRIYFDAKKEDVNLLKPVAFNEIGAERPVSIQAHAFSWKAVTLSTDQQLIYVVVQDQTLRPITGVAGTATIRWPDGTREMLAIVTNSKGIGVIPLSFSKLTYGSLVYVDILVSKDGLVSSTSTSFRIWY
jgi:hypothetical protein